MPDGKEGIENSVTPDGMTQISAPETENIRQGESVAEEKRILPSRTATEESSAAV